MNRFLLIVVPALLFLNLTSLSAYADVRVWRTSVNTNGNLGGRAGADAFCDADANKPTVANSVTRALISINAADEIRDMPANYAVPTSEPIFRQDGTTQIAPNFAALLNADSVPLTNSINGVAGTAGAAFTGSTNIGALHPSSCIGFTSISGSGPDQNGMSGLGNSTSGGYLEAGSTTCSNVTVGLFCITHTPARATAEEVPTLNPWLLGLLSMVFAGFIYRKSRKAPK
ncbi:MAG: DUF1554 domain-containing protein [Cellvibrionaceae bacterium]|nr:DUF1554 domain-containing protein [Cellvibrionaceae bacterium]